jgi:hypothetical protein
MSAREYRRMVIWSELLTEPRIRAFSPCEWRKNMYICTTAMPYRLEETLCESGNFQVHKQYCTHTAVTKPPIKAAPNVLSKWVGKPDTAANTEKNIAAGSKRGRQDLRRTGLIYNRTTGLQERPDCLRVANDQLPQRAGRTYRTALMHHYGLPHDGNGVSRDRGTL